MRRGPNPKAQKTPEYFWSKVVKTDTCWIWMGLKHRRGGYGTLTFQARKLLAHRLAYELTYGPIPAGLCVLHRCDNPPCVRPDHLWLGTSPENSADMVAKNRQAKKLSDDTILSIRQCHAEGMSFRKIATKYDIHDSTVADIVKLKIHRSLQKKPS